MYCGGNWLIVIFYLTYMHCFLCSELPANTPVNEARGYLKREHSLIRPYQGSGMSVPYWDFIGSTMVTTQYIRLTPDSQSRQGGLWNTMPCRSRDWEMHFTFAVHGSTGDLFGDGMALWYAKERNTIGSVFGSKDYFQGLAIIMDTYSNHNGPHNHAHPYVSAMVNNGSLHYDHDRDGTHTEIAGCEAKFRNKQYETSLLLRYVEDTISVYLDIHNRGVWEKCFSVPGVSLPTGYYFGASATTGELSDNHDVVSIRTYELDVPRPEKKDETDRVNVVPHAIHHAAPRDHIEDPAPSKLSGFKTFLLVIVGIAAVVVFLIAGVMIFQKRQEHSRKRFY